VSDWNTVFLGVIAVATLVMALLQVGAVVLATRVAARVDRLVTEVRGEIRPLIARAQGIAEDASRAATLAAAQAERVDALLAVMTRRVDETANVLQNAIAGPAREGVALIAALRAGFAALRGSRATPSTGSRFEEEDALFIG
jgi:hypothetical protein